MATPKSGRGVTSYSNTAPGDTHCQNATERLYSVLIIRPVDSQLTVDTRQVRMEIDVKLAFLLFIAFAGMCRNNKHN